ncbi:MAG TPA: type I-E CRISPR-associated protein Cse1/CasA [Sedimentisphaerales bacterium]|nr:type I-E CRISPR-associated protein Cse1/CasA [Sedimentisphaerales bacterium]HRS09717.1 type I-E CRISPR-associated protein Cse1/CasA [Sedimentisphaerales bacterium]HRV46398.1 type I-E CRISPR-associated protein Cse1/CasA [Sedimentisphaerales bacterium]
MTANYNLLDEHWIPVLYRDGRYDRVGIRNALEEAGQIRQIAASNPMDNVALLRFLLAVLIWCKGELTENDRTLLEGRADGIPPEWLNKLAEHKKKFNLLGDGERFYQDKTILAELLKAKQKEWDEQRKKAGSQKAPKKPYPTSLDDNDFRPIGDLLVEFPGADSVNHTRHVLHGSYGFCPACCATGILRFSVWASANRYYPASVNPGSAVYAIVAGDNLAQTLAASLPDNAHQTSEPPWLSDSPPSLPLETATVLAWRPRRLWLGDAAEKGVCANCGDHRGLIKT